MRNNEELRYHRGAFA